eukprot:41026-Amphidinium_carterae.1
MAATTAAGRQDYVLRTLRKAVQLHTARRAAPLALTDPKTAAGALPASQLSASQPDLSQACNRSQVLVAPAGEST